VSTKLPAGYTAHCNTFDYTMFGLEKQTGNTSNTTNTTDSSNSSAATYQIVLWVSILLGLTLAAVIYGMCTLSDGDDSLLYRTTKKAV